MNIDYLAQNSGLVIMTLAGGAMLAFVGIMSYLSNSYNLNRIKSKTTGDGQHGSARWATPKEITHTYEHVYPSVMARTGKARRVCTSA